MSAPTEHTSEPVSAAVYITPQGGRLTPWQKGQSGNPGGVSKNETNAYHQARRLCADATPEAVRIQIELMRSDDQRIQMLATQAIIERGAGKVRDHSDEEKQRATLNLDALTAEDRLVLARILGKVMGG